MKRRFFWARRRSLLGFYLESDERPAVDPRGSSRFGGAAICATLGLALLSTPAAGQGHTLGPGTFLAGSGSATGNNLAVYQQIGSPLVASSSGGGYGSQGGLATTIAGAASLELVNAPAANPAGHIATVTAHLSTPTFLGSPAAALYYRAGGASTVTPLDMFSAGDSLGVVIPGGAFSDRGIEFYLSANVGSLTLTVPQGKPLSNPLRIESRLTDYTALGALSTEGEIHRMISFAAHVDPASVASVLGDDLGESNREVWRFGRWNPVSNAYDEYEGSEGAVSPLAGGNAFWLITRNNALVDFSGLSQAPYLTGRGLLGFEVTLKPGWNQIGNPFAFPVQPDSIAVALGSDFYTFSGAVAAGLLETSPLRAYDPGSGAFPNAARLEPWTGYFVNNADPAGRDMIWTVPNQAATRSLRGGATPAVASTTESLAWFAQFAAADDHGDMGAAIVGLAEAAAATLDPLDRLAVPGPPGQRLHVACRNDEMPPWSGELTQDVRSLDWGTEGGCRWRLAVTCTEAGPARLSVSLQGELPAGAVARLVDPGAARHRDLDGNVLYEFVVSPGSLTRELLILVGSDQYVEKETRAEVAADLALALGPLSPNPAFSTPYLEFTLPENTWTELRVYDVTGRLVAELVDGVLPRGRHVIPWDRRTRSGRQVASGVYYVRLTANAESRVSKLVVVR